MAIPGVINGGATFVSPASLPGATRVLSVSAAGLIAAETAGDARTLLGLGTAALVATEDFDTAGTAAAAVASEASTRAAADTALSGLISSEASTRSAADTTLAGAITTHEADTTNVHGIADTSALYRAGGTDVAVADGGTGASTASAARANLGLVIGTDVEAHDADLTTIAALSPSNDDLLQRKAGAWANRSIAQLLTDLAAAGTTFQPLDSDLTAIAALTTTSFGRGLLALADASAGRTSLGLVIGTDIQAFDADLTALAALSGTNTIYYRSAANTWTAVTIGSNITFSGGTLSATSGGAEPQNGWTDARYYSGYSSIAPAATTLTVNRLYFVPIYIPAYTVTRVGINVTTQQTSSAARLGLYNNSNGVPTSLAYDWGTVACTATGEQEIAISQAITAGWYWLAIVANVASIQISGENGASAGGLSRFPNLGTSTGAGNSAICFYHSFTYAALPANASALTEMTGASTIPRIWLRKGV